MIRITLEMVSARGAERDRLLGVAYLANTGERDAHGHPNYNVWLSKTIPGRTQELWKTGRAAITPEDIALLQGEPDGEIQGFDNVKRGAWDLLYKALKAVGGGRN